MILTIVGADFSGANIGQNNTINVSFNYRNNNAVLSHTVPINVEKGDEINWTITLKEGYTFNTSGITLTMNGGTLTHSISDNTMTITSSTTVTGRIYITISANNENGEEIPEPEPEPLDSIAYGSLTYRDIFVTNNVAVNVNNNTQTVSVNGKYGYKTGSSAGAVSIVESNDVENNYIPSYSIFASGSQSCQIQMTNSKDSSTSYKYAKGTILYVAANIKVTRYNKGKCGIILGGDGTCTITEQTNGWVRKAEITPASEDAYSLFIGSASSADLDGYINNPVVVNSTVFTATKPTRDEWIELYNNYNNILLNS